MSDNGKQFDNPKFRDFCAELEIKNYCDAPNPGCPLTTRQPAETLVNVG